MDYEQKAADIHDRTDLSEKEAQVALLRSQGHTFEAIGDELDMSPQAAHAHSRRATMKYERCQQTVETLERIEFIE